MDEDDLRAALRDTMTVEAPPPMESAAALAAGRRSARRHAAVLGAGTAVAVVAVVAVWGAGAGLAGGGGGLTQVAGPGGQALPPGVISTPAPATSEAPVGEPGGSETAPSWPLDGDGQPQSDATAKSGHRFEQGVKLLEQLRTAVPAGWTLPEGNGADQIPFQSHQAQVEGDNTGSTWGYLAQAAIAKDGRTGKLLAEVHTTGNGLPTDPCALGGGFWSLTGTCELVEVAGRTVAVLTESGDDDRIDMWAAYRHEDGTVVYIAQSRTGGGTQPLTDLPLTGEQLAALAVDPRFQLR